jgi:L-ribulose-5-phosphate 4-epimerase
MRLKQLREQVLEANLEIVRRGLVIYTFGNASGVSREEGLVAIKPSGVAFNELKPEHMVLADLDGKIVEGDLRPSSDLETHLVLYRAFASIGGVVHTHSTYACAFAQAGREIPCLGTTHADYWYGAVPVTDPMDPVEIEAAYEKNTGKQIVRRYARLSPEERPGVLVHGHGPFAWGESPAKAAFHAVMLEELARSAYLTLTLNADAGPLQQAQINTHYLRKHGPGATYGQK